MRPLGRVGVIGAADNGDLEGTDVEVRHEDQLFDVRLRNGLEPDCLPDPGLGGVPDRAAVEPLLAAGVRAVLGEVPDPHLEQLVGRALTGRSGGCCSRESPGDIEGEGEIAAGVRADLVAVDPDRARLVDGTEVKQEPTTRDRERAP